MGRNLKDLGQKYSRESRKQDTVGASKNRDTGRTRVSHTNELAQGQDISVYNL